MTDESDIERLVECLVDEIEVIEPPHARPGVFRLRLRLDITVERRVTLPKIETLTSSWPVADIERQLATAKQEMARQRIAAWKAAEADAMTNDIVWRGIIGKTN